uniref:Uncharacterized protein n=1 Tax=Anguilla anguilla TaxID=7936 RepID=A0A0E9Q6P3_ANGAN
MRALNIILDKHTVPNTCGCSMPAQGRYWKTEPYYTPSF